MDYTSLTDQQLLERVIGITATARHFTGALAPLFAGEEQPALEPLLAAHELFRRWLIEELRYGDALASPGQVKAMLATYFANGGNFVVM